MSETPELIPEDPPPIKRAGSGARAGQTPVGLWLAALRDTPGVWHRYPDRVHARAPASISRGRYGVEPGEFEALSRNLDDRGRGLLYARYVGGGS